MKIADKQDKEIAKAILRSTSVDEETRLDLARKFDPSITSMAQAFTEDVQRYQESVISTRPKTDTSLKTEISLTQNGEIYRNIYRGSRLIDSEKINPKKDGAR